MTKYAAIRGWGMYTPERVMTNDDLAAFVDTSDEWIRSRTGIAQRHIVADDETTATLATRAGREALAQADLPADQLDLIIVATCSPDYLLPSTPAWSRKPLAPLAPPPSTWAPSAPASCTRLSPAPSLSRPAPTRISWSSAPRPSAAS